MKNFATYLLAATVGLTMLGCSKKDETPSKTELLTNKNWISSAVTISPAYPLGGTLITDYYAQQRSCDKDDFIRFETPSTFKYDEGASKCATPDPQTTIGTWAFNGDQTVITVTPQGGTADSYEVTELTDNSLKYSTTFFESGITYTLTYTRRKL